MTPGQIARLQELSKCYIVTQPERAVIAWISGHEKDDRLSPGEKYYIRRLTHQYRNQIAAIKRNQGVK
jgi:hypothetical protein